MTKVVAIEGLPFTGKTSSIAYNAALAPEWETVGEYHDIVDPGTLADYRNRPTSTDDQDDRVNTYLRLDAVRWATARDAIDRGRPVVLDRCHLSIIAYSIALSVCYGIGDPQLTVQRYRQAIADADSPIGIADDLIMLDVSVDVAVDRLRLLNQDIDPNLATPPFVTELVNAYRIAIDEFPGTLHSINAEASLDDVQQQVAATLREIQ